MKSQRLLVFKYLIEHGSITDEKARELGINRLAVMIERLRKDGMVIDVFHPNGGKGIYIWRK